MTTTKNSLPAVSLLLDESRGIYIPNDFVNSFDLGMWTECPDDISILLEGPDHESYWEIWDEVLSDAKFVENGHTWKLHQDGSLWAYCFELMTDEEIENMGFNGY